MTDLYNFLGSIQLNLDQIMLDPNNPRFADFENGENPVPESRITEDRVQRDAFERMKLKRFDVAELRDTIKSVGYLPMDRIVVREWSENKKNDKKRYVVVEGNRRIAALKWLIELHDTGRETLASEQINNFTNIPALLLDEKNSPDQIRYILPGLRHVSGVKEWGAYQRAKAVHLLREAGETPKDVAQSLGLSTQAANLLWRSYLSLEQMREDDEFGEFADPRMYSYFEEIHKRPNVRIWLNWDDDKGKFTNEDRVKELYGWIVGELSDGEERSDPKLPEAKSVRDLGRVIDDPVAFEVFRSPDGNLTRALARYESGHREAWQGAISNAYSTLESLTPDMLRNMLESDVNNLNDLIKRIQKVIEDRNKLV
jgi:hypothetical protein